MHRQCMYRLGVAMEQQDQLMLCRQMMLFSVFWLAQEYMYGTIAHSLTAQWSKHCTAGPRRSVSR
jgi:hypothetical protein